ncbi:MAG: DUF2244 domain-containing protein [Alphaproteobacteria bacterium]
MGVIEPSSRRGEDGPILAIVLTPHRSLNRRGFAIGAWPVVGFMGLDIAFVFIAFRLNFRAARAAQEIHLTRDALTVRDITASGKRTETRFNPYWARLEITRRPEHGIVDIRLISRGLRLEIGRFLPLPQREQVANVLADALAEARAVPV